MAINQIITRVSLQGAQAFERGLSHMGRAVQVFERGAQRAGQSIRSALSNPLNLLAGAGGTAGIALMAKSAMDASGNFERLTKTMEALTGSTARAAQEMAFVERFAAQSPFEFSDLAEAATLMQAFGLETQRQIGYIESLSAAFGPTRQNLMEVVSLFGRLRSGQTGEAFEIARRFGLGRDTLEQAGLRFNRSGQLMSSAGEAMAALERVIEQRFGDIRERLGGTLVVAASNFRDAWTRALRVVGDVFRPLVTGTLERVVSFIQFATETGKLEHIAQSFGKLFAGLAGSDWMERLMAFVAVLADMMPQLLAVVGDALRQYFDNLIAGTENVLNRIMSGMIDVINAVIERLNIVRVYLRMPAIPLREHSPLSLGQMARNLFGNLPGGEALQSWADILSLRTGALLNEFRGYGGTPSERGMGPSAATLQPLHAIAQASRETAQNTRALTDLKQFALGGGDLGALGVTPVELQRLSRDVVVRIEGQAGSTIEQLITQIVQKTVGAMARKRML
ncbi:MAG: hypothetical protein KIT45_06640 [Fimbriimonadia bacterium]|nr:hypothetical protein [Fimbriimonadia bacterium]